MFSSSSLDLDRVEALRKEIAPLFIPGDTTLDHPYQGCIRFRGHFLQDPIDCFDQLRQICEKYRFTPHIRQDTYQIAVIGLPVVFEKQPTRWAMSLGLFIATVISTLHLGASYTLDGIPA